MKLGIKNFFVKILIRLIPLYQSIYVQWLRRKKKINIVFYASSLAMWRYQHLYEKISVHPHFKTTIVILPTIYSREQQKQDAKRLISFFTKKNIPYVLGQNEKGESINIKKVLSPDIIFYPQPYVNFYEKPHKFYFYMDRLLCYYPYAFWTNNGYWSYNLLFHNLAWKLFYSTELHKKDAYHIAYNKGRNVEVVGYPTADDFLYREHIDFWKHQESKKKRVIWAPHFTISSGGFLSQSNFLWMADFMLEIAVKYFNDIQFTFKPHPRLYSELCKSDVWGIKKTDEYYNKWATMQNTQIETGEFVDLFMTSDAMVHDSGSFSVEYLYANKPVMYIAKDFEEQLKKCSEFGEMAMRQQYLGSKQEDIIRFIENIVLGGDDYMAVERKEFVETYLVSPNGKTVADNTMDVLLKELC